MQTQNHKYWFFSNRNEFGISDTSGALDTTIEETDDQIDDGIEDDNLEFLLYSLSSFICVSFPDF